MDASGFLLVTPHDPEKATEWHPRTHRHPARLAPRSAAARAPSTGAGDGKPWVENLLLVRSLGRRHVHS